MKAQRRMRLPQDDLKVLLQALGSYDVAMRERVDEVMTAVLADNQLTPQTAREYAKALKKIDQIQDKRHRQRLLGFAGQIVSRVHCPELIKPAAVSLNDPDEDVRSSALGVLYTATQSRRHESPRYALPGKVIKKVCQLMGEKSDMVGTLAERVLENTIKRQPDEVMEQLTKWESKLGEGALSHVGVEDAEKFKRRSRNLRERFEQIKLSPETIK